MVRRGLSESPVSEVLLEESVHGWKEFEMEVMRDKSTTTCVIICSIENFDPMGVHTGDSITVAPAQTLTDKEYQRMRDASLAVIREIGVETGGSNIQFAIEPDTGRMIVIEMNPRVSRSSALASKATGFPIAKIAAKLAVGYRLHELANDITRETRACFEPTIDYVVTKIPRFAFEKFLDADDELTTQMKSVGETMAIGRTFRESFQKALRGSRSAVSVSGATARTSGVRENSPVQDDIRAKISRPHAWRVWYLRYAIKEGFPLEEIYDLTGIDPWFLENLFDLVRTEEAVAAAGSLTQLDDELLLRAKRDGFSDRQLPTCSAIERDDRPGGSQKAGDRRHVQGGRYLRGGVRGLHALLLLDLRKGRRAPAQGREKAHHDPRRRAEPHRAGHRVRLLLLSRQFRAEANWASSRSWSTRIPRRSDRLRHQRHPLFRAAHDEDVLNICDADSARRTHRAVRRANAAEPGPGAENAGVPIIGTSVDTIDEAEDRELSPTASAAGSPQPANAIAKNLVQSQKLRTIGFPVLVRPSFVLGGRAMEICYDQRQFDRFVMPRRSSWPRASRC